MARQFIYHMQGLTKTYPGNRKVLENINLSFYPDAKIGVLGVNGSGKSTLLRIMAGIDKDFVGDGWVAEGARVGYLQQEPQLDADKNVRDNVMEGVAAKKALIDRYNEIAANYSDETADEMAKLQDEIDSKNLWDLDSQVTLAMDALRCPPDDADVTSLSGGERRRVALCKLLLEQPDLLLLDEPTNHLDAESVHWLEGHLRNYPPHCHGSGQLPDRPPAGRRGRDQPGAGARRPRRRYRRRASGAGRGGAAARRTADRGGTDVGRAAAVPVR
jgi:ATPase subunit of ABC transporter with duplicated ATPase domains